MLVCPKHRHFIDGDSIYLDTEGTGLNAWRGDRPFTFSFANLGGDTICWTFGVDPFTRKPIVKPAALEAMKRLLEDEAIRKTGANIKYDVRMMDVSYRIKTIGRIDDVLWKAHVVNSNEPKHALKPLSMKYRVMEDTNMSDDDEEELGDAVKTCRLHVRKLKWKIAKGESSEDKKAYKADYWLPRAVCDLAPREVRDPLLERWPNLRKLNDIYATRDVIRTLMLDLFYTQIMDEEDLWTVYEREIHHFPVTYQTETNGMCVYEDRCKALGDECDRKLVELRRDLSKIFGEFNVEVPDNRVRKYMFDPPEQGGLGLKVIRKTEKSKQPSVDKETKDLYANTVPVVAQLQDFDRHQKVRAHYVDKYISHSILEYADPMPFVVHCKKGDYDVYIGRGNCPKTGEFSGWGNPFKIGTDGTRGDVVEKYAKWVLLQPGFVQRIRTELVGKKLGCWCSPEACHGHVLASIANANRIIHADIRQIGATTGRMSVADPPLHQIPKRAKAGDIRKRAREPFGPRRGNVWIHNDFMSIEPRILADEADEKDILAIFNSGGDPYNVLVDRVALATKRTREILEEMFEGRGGARQVCKNNFLGWTYGEGIRALAAQMGCSYDEAVEIIHALQAAFGGVRPFMQFMQNLAKKQGFIRNRYGRKCVIPPPSRVLDEDGMWRWAEWWYKATNYLIQGTAADMLKEAGIALGGEDHWYAWNAEEGVAKLPCTPGYLKGTAARIVIPIHDEIIVEMPYKLALNEKFVRGIGEVMGDNKGMFTKVATPTESKVTWNAWSEPEPLESLWS